MVDISKKKEEVKKEIRSLLLSAPVGLTLAELERDYCLFMGNKLPSAELGYASAEEFLKDIPDIVQMTYKAGTLVLTGISDVTTKHIEKLVSNQRLDARKNWATLKIPTAPALSMGQKNVWNKWHFSAYNESAGSRSINSSPNQGWGQQIGHPLNDFRQTEVRSDSRYKTNTSLLGSPHEGPCSYSQHQTVRSPPLLRDIQLAEPCVNTYDRNPRIHPLLKDFQETDPHTLHRTVRIPPLLRDTQHVGSCICSYCRNVGKVPLFIQNNVDMIVKAFSLGVPLIHFPNIYRKHFGCTLDFWKLGFSSLYDLLSSLGDIVSLKKSSTGETWVMKQNNFQGHPFYNGPVCNRRPAPETVYKTDHVLSSQGRTMQTGKSLPDASTDAEEKCKAQSGMMCQMPALDVEKASDLSKPPSDTQNSLSSHSNKTQNPQASQLDEAHGSLTSQLDKPHGSLTSQLDKPHGSLTSQLDKPHGSLTSQLDKSHGSITSQLDKPHGSLTSQPDKPHGSLTSQLDEAHGSLTSQLDKPHGSLTSQLDKPHGSLTSQLDKPHGSLTSQPDKPHGSLTSQLDKPHGSLTSHPDKPHGSLTSETDEAHGSLTSQPDRPHGSLTSQLDKPHGSLTSQLDKPHGSLTSQLDKPHGSLISQLDKPHGSLTSQLDKPHGSLTSQKDKPHGSLTSQKDKPHGSLTSQKDKAHGSHTSHPDKPHGSLTSQKDDVFDSHTSHLDESHSSANSHLGRSCNIPLVVQNHIRQIMEERQRGLYASRLPFEYWNLFKEELPLKKLGYSSVVEFASQLPHIIKVERPHPQGDWHLLPASVTTMSEISDRTLTANLDTKISSFHADGSTRETVAQTLGMQHDVLPVDNFDRVCKEKSDPGNACATADVNACNNEADSSNVLSISALEQALSTLEVKRNRLLNRIIMENDCSSKSVDELTEIEQNMTRVGTEISKLQNNPAQTINLQPLASDPEKQLSQSVTKPECSKPSASGQIKSMQKVAPMQRGLLSQKEPVIKPTNTSAQTMLDMTSLLQEQILLNQILMEKLKLSHEKLPSQLPPKVVTQGVGNRQLLSQPGQPLSQPGHQPLIGNLTVNLTNLLNPDLLLGTCKNGNLLQQNPWPLQSSSVMYQGLRQLNHLLQVNHLSTIPQSALNSGLTNLNIGVKTSRSLTEPH